MVESRFSLFPQTGTHDCRFSFIRYFSDDVRDEYNNKRRYPHPYKFTFEYLYALITEKLSRADRGDPDHLPWEEIPLIPEGSEEGHALASGGEGVQDPV